MKAVDTRKRNDGGRVVLTFYGLCKKLVFYIIHKMLIQWSGSAALTSIENLIDTYSSTNQSTESTENNDSRNIESGSSFGESNYSDEATERRSKTRKLLENHRSEKIISKSGAAIL